MKNLLNKYLKLDVKLRVRAVMRKRIFIHVLDNKLLIDMEYN